MPVKKETERIFYIAPDDKFANFFDCYAGGGGSGSGILKAYDRLGITPSGTFVNHWDKAIEIHAANHPEHRHFKEDLFLMDPKVHMPKKRYGLGWASPSCQQFSLSRGNRPINEQGRSHADTVVEWMAHCRPECQIVENVRQFKAWCRLKQRRCKKTNELQWAREVPGKKKGTTKIKTFPHLDPAHARQKGEVEAEWELRMISLGYDRHLEPDLQYQGEYFDAWVKRIEALGYISDHRLLRSADYGDPTIRQRLFVQFVRIDTGKRIVWPDQRFIKPGAKRPEFKTNKLRELLPWPTARNSVIEWDIKGQSIFDPARKALAPATKRRIAIGTVRFAFRDFLVPQSNFGGDRVRSTDEPVSTVQCNHRGEGIAEPFALTSNKGFDCGIRDLDKPSATTCNSRGEGLVEPLPFILPKDQGHLADYVCSIDQPVPAVQTTAHDHLVEPCIIQMNGQSTAISADEPLGALTGMQKQYVMEPCIAHLRGTGTATGVNQPVHTVTGGGNHMLLAEAFLQVMDNAGKGGAGQRAFSADEPLKTIPVKANHTLVEPVATKVDRGIRFSLETLEDAVAKVAPAGVDISRVMGLMEPLMEELRKAGRADIRPWIYVYYSNGAVGADIDTPVPTLRCKEGTAVCYPVLEFDGEFMLLDILYRMLTVRELQRAQGFPSWTWSCKGIACRKQFPTSSRSAASKDAVESSELKSTGAGPGKPVAVHARIDFGRGVLVLRSAQKSKGPANDAAVFGSCPLPTQIAASARELAGMLKTLERQTQSGGEATRPGSCATGDQNRMLSTSPRSGSPSGTPCESVTTIHAEDVGNRISVSLSDAPGLLTTSEAGGTSRSCVSILRTLCSFVADAIASCTQSEIQQASSFALTIEVSDDFVWPAGITKTDIVKAIGNSVSCGVAEALVLAWHSQSEDISGFFENAAKAA